MQSIKIKLNLFSRFLSLVANLIDFQILNDAFLGKVTILLIQKIV
jgi:hypothetical protein